MTELDAADLVRQLGAVVGAAVGVVVGMHLRPAVAAWREERQRRQHRDRLNATRPR